MSSIATITTSRKKLGDKDFDLPIRAAGKIGENFLLVKISIM